MPEIYLIGLVPLYSFLTGLWLYQPLRSKELPVMVLISSVGFGVCNAAGRWIFNRDDVVSACGAFVIGSVLLYSEGVRSGAELTM